VTTTKSNQERKKRLAKTKVPREDRKLQIHLKAKAKGKAKKKGKK